MRNDPPPLLPLLRSRVQGDLLALLYLNPERDYSLSEAARAIGANVKTVHTEANRLVEAGFIRDSRRANIRLLRAAEPSPVTRALSDLLTVTYGPRPVLTDLLSGVPGVEQAFIYGSWAARYSGETGGIPNDIDVIVVGTISREDLYDIAEAAQSRLGREVNIRRVRPESWASPNPADPFMKHVRERPLVELDLRNQEGRS